MATTSRWQRLLNILQPSLDSHTYWLSTVKYPFSAIVLLAILMDLENAVVSFSERCSPPPDGLPPFFLKNLDALAINAASQTCSNGSSSVCPLLFDLPSAVSVRCFKSLSDLLAVSVCSFKSRPKLSLIFFVLLPAVMAPFCASVFDLFISSIQVEGSSAFAREMIGGGGGGGGQGGQGKARFIHIIRDGRAVVSSLQRRGVKIKNVDTTDSRKMFDMWKHFSMRSYNKCNNFGKDICINLRYERLILHTEEILRKISKFLGIPFHGQMMHHERLVGKGGGKTTRKIQVSNTEKSTDDVKQAIYNNSLTAW
mmetsp:Transcript_16859/g.26879  ORF Transcript_16859/g.26879 Transcript_16859/m.26879 type:complete len:311 (-) Transcript_16859:94-1026(-)